MVETNPVVLVVDSPSGVDSTGELDAEPGAECCGEEGSVVGRGDVKTGSTERVKGLHTECQTDPQTERATGVLSTGGGVALGGAALAGGVEGGCAAGSGVEGAGVVEGGGSVGGGVVEGGGSVGGGTEPVTDRGRTAKLG